MNLRQMFTRTEQLAQVKSSRNVLRSELGGGGVAYFNGLISSDEFNDKLVGQEAVQTYDKMRRTDAQVAALINTCRLPLLSASWDVDRPPEEEQADKITDDHLDFARDNLFRRIHFQTFLDHATSCVWAGFALCEIVYGVDDGKIVLSKLAPRLASTIEKWYTDEAGELTGVQQKVFKDAGYRFIDIPRDKLVLFTYGREANNYPGCSILRPVYKHWFIKDTIYKLDAIRCERYAVGVPLITLPADYDDSLYEMAETIGKNWKGASQSYVVAPTGMTVEIIAMKGGETLDLLSTISHHNEEIAKVGLAQFINLGHTETGSRSLGEVTTQFFYDAEEGWAEQIGAMINRQVLWPLMDMNFPGEIRPVITIQDLGSVALGELVGVLRDVGAEYLPPALDLENAVRERLNLPQRAEEEAEEPKPPPKPVSKSLPEDEEKPVDEMHVHLTSSPSEMAVPEESDFWRPLRPAERHVALRQMSGMIDDSRDKMLRVMLAAREGWVASLAEQVKGRIKEGPLALSALVVPDELIKQAYDRVIPIMDDVYDYGSDQVRRELKSQKTDGLQLRNVPPTTEEVAEIVEARASFMLTRLSRKTQEAAEAIALDMYRTVGPDDFGYEDTQRLMANVVDTTEYEARLTALMSVTETLNLGRDAAAQELAEEIRICEYSAIMDQNTCDNCASADGQQRALGSSDYYDLTPPLRSERYGRCAGLGSCRCIWVYILKEELQLAS